MNEQIKQLAEQSGIHFSRAGILDGDPNGIAKFVSYSKFEEYTKLLVQECVNICLNENVSNLDMNTLRESGKFTIQELATKSCGENLAKRIERHFGV